MVKQINVAFDDMDHKQLEEKKGPNKTWHNFILELLNKEDIQEAKKEHEQNIPVGN